MASRAVSINSTEAGAIKLGDSESFSSELNLPKLRSDKARPASCTPGRRLPPTPEGPLLMDASLSSSSGDGQNVGTTPRSPLANTTEGGYGPFFLEYTLMAEYQLIKKIKPSGLYVVPSATCRLVWNGVVFLRQGLYQDAVFRFNIHIPDTFPDGDCPMVVFSSPVFHPLVHPVTGVLDVKREFSKWRRNYNRLWQVVKYVRQVFYKIESSLPSNQNAATLYEQDLDAYKAEIARSIQASRDDLFLDPDPNDAHAIRFSKMDSDQIAEKKRQMLQQKDGVVGSSTGAGSRISGYTDSSELKTIQSLGMSWMSPGSTDIFTKDEITLDSDGAKVSQT